MCYEQREGVQQEEWQEIVKVVSLANANDSSSNQATSRTKKPGSTKDAHVAILIVGSAFLLLAFVSFVIARRDPKGCGVEDTILDGHEIGILLYYEDKIAVKVVLLTRPHSEDEDRVDERRDDEGTVVPKDDAGIECKQEKTGEGVEDNHGGRRSVEHHATEVADLLDDAEIGCPEVSVDEQRSRPGAPSHLLGEVGLGGVWRHTTRKG